MLVPPRTTSSLLLPGLPLPSSCFSYQPHSPAVCSSLPSHLHGSILSLVTVYFPSSCFQQYILSYSHLMLNYGSFSLLHLRPLFPWISAFHPLLPPPLGFTSIREILLILTFLSPSLSSLSPYLIPTFYLFSYPLLSAPPTPQGKSLLSLPPSASGTIARRPIAHI